MDESCLASSKVVNLMLDKKIVLDVFSLGKSYNWVKTEVDILGGQYDLVDLTNLNVLLETKSSLNVHLIKPVSKKVEPEEIKCEGEQCRKPVNTGYYFAQKDLCNVLKSFVSRLLR